MKNKVFIGNIGSGKTRSICNLVDKQIDNNESLFILDSKYEYINKYYDLLQDCDYNTKIIDLRELSNSETFNPLLLPYEIYKEKKSDLYLEMLEKVSKYIVNSTDAIDPFWENSAADLITGIILSLFYKGKMEEINFSSVDAIINCGALESYFSEYKDTQAWMYASASINAPRETLGGIIATARQKIRMYVSRDNLSKYLSTTSFEYKELLNNKMAIFFVNYDSTSTYNDLVNIFISELYMYLESNMKTNFNFVLDNFDSLGYMYDFKEMFSAANNYKMSFIIGTRDIYELESKYCNLSNVSDKVLANDLEMEQGEKRDYANKLVDEVSVIDLSKFIDTKK